MIGEHSRHLEYLLFIALYLVTFSLQGCGSSGGDTIIYSAPGTEPANAPANLSVSAEGVSCLTFEWDFVKMVDHFSIDED